MSTKTRTAATKPKAPREGSRKRKVYDAFKSKGADEATKLGASLKLKDSTLKTWVRSWA